MMYKVSLLPRFLAGAAVCCAVLTLTSMQGALTTHRTSCLTAEQQEILSHMSIVYLDDGTGGFVKTIRIEGVNLQVVNGLDDTTTANGVGNIIVGYNELSAVFSDVRTGSHNFVAGNLNNYSSYGGIIVGHRNTISAPYASITAGQGNRAIAAGASVSGGSNNTASGISASVSGGSSNAAPGLSSSVTGGSGNVSQGVIASVTGGSVNYATGDNSSIAGGHANTTTGYGASISGGQLNSAAGNWATVGGGRSRTAPGDEDWVAGSLFEDD